MAVRFVSKSKKSLSGMMSPPAAWSPIENPLRNVPSYEFEKTAIERAGIIDDRIFRSWMLKA